MNYDLIVVGTSFASSFFLSKYLDKNKGGVKVLVLERGKHIQHGKRLKNVQRKPRNEVDYRTVSDSSDTYHNVNPEKSWLFDSNFGGSSNCWTGCTPRFMPNDFRLKTTYNVGLDWPIAYEDIEPYYCDAEKMMGISGPDHTPYPMSSPYPLPPHKLSSVDLLMQRKYPETYFSQPTARSSITHGRNKCCNSSVCHMCPNDAKFTIENGLMHLYDDPRVTVRFDAQVVELLTNASHVKGVTYLSTGKETEVKGEVIALGANPIFNAHILLNSGDTNPVTGHYLAEQRGFTAYLYLDNLENTGGSTIITANGFEYYDTVDRNKLAACMVESHNGFYVRHEHRKWRQIARFKFIFEDLPQYKNKVGITSDRGKPVVDYKSASPYVARGFDYVKSKLNDYFSPLPVEQVFLEDQPVESEGHIIGTTRMSTDASQGVVDKHLIHHQYRNLFVLGAGCFPTISPANPTLTLSALSLWSADKNF